MFNTLTSRFSATVQSALNSRVARDESGATAVEYGLIVGLIAIAIVGAISLLGGHLQGLFTSIDGKLPTP